MSVDFGGAVPVGEALGYGDCVLTEREEKAFASSAGFSDWTHTFTDPRLSAAIVDRLTLQGTVIETGTDSYRLNHTRATTTRRAKGVGFVLIAKVGPA